MSNEKLYCKDCKEFVVPVNKIFKVKLCPKCSIIIDNGIYSMDKVG